MYASLECDYLKKTEKQALEKFRKDCGDDRECLEYPELKDDITELDLEDDEITVSIDNDLGFFCFRIPLDMGMYEKVISVAIKKMNKLKTLMETVK